MQNSSRNERKRADEKLSADLNSYKQQVSKLNVTQVELKEELEMKQTAYVAEVHSRLQYQQALSKIVEICQERSRDTKLVEDVLKIADARDQDYTSVPTGIRSGNLIFRSTRPGLVENIEPISGHDHLYLYIMAD